jgi:hypothetical protein
MSRIDSLTQIRVRLTHATTQVSPTSPERIRQAWAGVPMDTKDPTVGRDFLTCHTQKNGEDGEQRQHAQKTEILGPWHVTCLMTIVQRFVRLVGDRSDVPLCACRADDGRICIGTPAQACRILSRPVGLT